jgi:hypothetical protein
MKHFVLAIVFAFLGLGLVAFDHHAMAADVGSGSAFAVAPSSAALHDPTVDPLAAIGDVRGLTARWPLLVLAIGIMLAKVLHYAGDKFGPVGKWLAVGHRAMIVAAVAGVLSALYDSIGSGGTWATALFAAGVAAVALISPKAAAA